MNFIALKAKVFALSILIFAISVTAAAQRSSIYTLPAGTKIRLKMDAGISSKISSVNDTFTTTVTEPISADGVVILPFGTPIEGRVVKVSHADHGGRDGTMQLRFETIRFSDRVKRSIDGVLVDELKPGSTKTASLVSIVGGAIGGALIGAIAGSGKGVLAGAGIGAAAGTAVAFAQKGKDVSIRTDEQFEIELKREVTLPTNAY
ncbi:MAG: hypothetical protein AB7F88_09540 [Pyrinomonadaceae bacterium]